ncbi:MAG: protein-L-isoaspartate(D-aspartate) O-methyltransferase [Deltaproteobacteria bacterium]|nr:protein-L-isoaspartate(D-aspartate) O-methyltransferase [Deltaproteobacteria bacterium]
MTHDAQREQMIETQLIARGIHDERVLAAMRRVPRHEFVDPNLIDHAYDDSPLPIGAQQTISQPYIVARMSELLTLGGDERVLEIGTGSGYQTAILAELAATVFSIERIPELAEQAQRRIVALGYSGRAHIRVGDGNLGWQEEAPFDAILVAAAVQKIPRPLVQQLRPSGVLVLPLGDAEAQGLARVRRISTGLDVEYFGECRFVKLIGEYGWEE